MQPLVLLLLLTFFLIVALAFTVWGALRVGDAARRGGAQTDLAPRREREAAPWEVSRKPAAGSRRPVGTDPKVKAGAAGADQDAGAPEPSGRGRRGEGRRTVRESEAPPHVAVARNSLWERSGQPLPEAPRSVDEEARGSRVVVTPRQKSEDAFERFLESEKRRG